MDNRICKTCGKVDYSCVCPIFNGDGESGPRAFTEEEVRLKIINHLRVISKYWCDVEGPETTQERLDGFLFSTLVMFDGGSMELPAIDMVLCPHPEDEQYNKDNGKNWFEAGMVVNDCQMHDLLCSIEAKGNTSDHEGVIANSVETSLVTMLRKILDK